jgi:hypothetical protein
MMMTMNDEITKCVVRRMLNVVAQKSSGFMDYLWSVLTEDGVIDVWLI